MTVMARDEFTKTGLGDEAPEQSRTPFLAPMQMGERC